MDSQELKPVENKHPLLRICDTCISWIFGIVLSLAAVPHLENSYYFLGSVYAYKLVDPGIGQMVAIVLPLTQLVIAVLLLGRIFVDTANVAAMILFGVFVVVQSFAFFGGLDISCGCFGPGHDSPIGWFSLSQVYGLLILSCLRNGIFFGTRANDMA